MEGNDRRTFLKRSAAALSAVALTRCAPADAGGGPAGARALSPGTLRAVADVVLPSELGPEGRERGVAAFEAWLADFEPVVEQDHGYGTSEIEYGPPDPAPAWAAQLEALELEAERRHGTPFPELEAGARETLLRRQLDEIAGDRLPAPLEAPHVALGLLSWWCASAEALDRCYGVRIAALTCRGLDGASQVPQPLGRS